jgi:putative membrane protein
MKKLPFLEKKMWVLLLILVGAGIYFIYRYQKNKDTGFGFLPDSQKDESALEIARKRYARGEITREQFEKIRHDLE